MTLLNATELELHFGNRTLFENCNLTIEEGEHIGLIGVNGSGKSTLMKILAGVIMPDGGEIQRKKGLNAIYLPQEPEFGDRASVASELSTAYRPLHEAMEEYAVLSKQLESSSTQSHDRLLTDLSNISERIEQLGGWDTEHRARALLDRLGVKDWDRPIQELSGGNRKRVAIAKALLSCPDLLLLDEPTNHLDAETVDWLEEELDSISSSLLLVTHDRYFLDDLVDRILEIDQLGSLISYPGNYQAYLEQKIVALEQASEREHKRQRWISQEVAWLRKGPKARTTKSKSRIDRARKIIADRGFQPPKVAEFQTVVSPRMGHTVLETEHVDKSLGGKVLLKDFNFILQPGERVGILGPNGIGKTTFLRLLMNEIEPDSGQIILGKNTKMAYYDQQRNQLDPEKSVYESASGEDFIEIGGERVSLRSYLEDMLFPVPMQKMAVKALSGGERNRLLLAKLFLQGANVLILDEPTNDLDIVTLNVLERLLLSFKGSVLLVTHDRYFIDKVSNSILAFEGGGQVIRYPGNFETYKRLKAEKETKITVKKTVQEKTKDTVKSLPSKQEKLTFKEQKELDQMEELIETCDRKKANLEEQLGDPSTFLSQSKEQIRNIQMELESVQNKMDQLYLRWEELMKKTNQARIPDKG